MQVFKSLLESTLPLSIAERFLAIREKNEKNSQRELIADYHSEAIIIFFEVLNLETISSPEEMLKILSKVFSLTDFVCNKHNVTKIKSVGSTLILTSGIPSYLFCFFIIYFVSQNNQWKSFS